MRRCVNAQARQGTRETSWPIGPDSESSDAFHHSTYYQLVVTLILNSVTRFSIFYFSNNSIPTFLILKSGERKRFDIAFHYIPRI